jgi:hypothetical protein
LGKPKTSLNAVPRIGASVASECSVMVHDLQLLYDCGYSAQICGDNDLRVAELPE